MDKNLKIKTAAIIAILLVFCYGFLGIPGGLSPTSLKQALADHIKLGLDLKGGTHLVLVVHVEEAVGSATDRDVQRISDDLQKTAGVSGAQVHKLDPVNHPDTITVSGFPATKASDVRSVLTGNDYANYDVTSQSDGSEKVTMKPTAIRDLEATTLQHTIEVGPLDISFGPPHVLERGACRSPEIDVFRRDAAEEFRFHVGIQIAL